MTALLNQMQPDSRHSTDKSLAGPGRKQARKYIRDARDFNNIETRDVVEFFFFLQGKEPKEIHAILTETLACFLPGRIKDLSASLNSYFKVTRLRTVCPSAKSSMQIRMYVYHFLSSPETALT